MARARRRSVGRNPNASKWQSGLETAWTPSTPPDPRAKLPLSERKVTQTTLQDGTVLTDYQDPPLSIVEQLPPVDGDWPLDPEPLPPPRPPRDGRKDRWAGLK